MGVINYNVLANLLQEAKENNFKGSYKKNNWTILATKQVESQIFYKETIIMRVEKKHLIWLDRTPKLNYDKVLQIVTSYFPYPLRDEISCEPPSLPELRDVVISYKKVISRKECKDAHMGYSMSKRTIYHNCITGERFYSLDDLQKTQRPFTIVPHHLKSSLNVVKLHSFNYINSLDAIVHRLFLMDTTIPSIGETRPPQEISRAYLFRDGKTYKQNIVFYSERFWHKSSFFETHDAYWGDDRTFHECDPSDFTMSNITNLTESYSLDDMDSKTFDHFKKVFSSFLGTYIPSSGNKVICWNNLTALTEYFNIKEKAKRNGAIQTRIDNLINIELPPVLESYYTRSLNSNGMFSFGSAQRVSDENPMCVIRLFYKIPDNDMFEITRIFFTKDEIFACHKNKQGEYVPLNVFKLTTDNWHFTIDTIPPEVVEGTKLEYWYKMINASMPSNRGVALSSLLSNPIVEKLYKAGLQEYITNLTKNLTKSNIMDFLEQDFGKIKEGSRLLSQLGINAYQFDLIKEFLNEKVPNTSLVHLIADEINITRYTDTPILFAKKLQYISQNNTEVGILSRTNGGMVNENISSWDNERTKTFFEIAKNMIHFGSSSFTFSKTCFYIVKMWNFQTLLTMIDSIMGLYSCLLINSSEEFSYTYDHITMYNDYLHMVEIVKDADVNIYKKPYFSSPEDIQTMHDNLLAYLRIQKDNLYIPKWKKRESVWKAFEYSDNKYSIVIPKAPIDLINEGINLNHCVDTYIDRVATGHTNIVFIRKNEDLDKSFFTVEISPQNVIEQVHGFANSNADTVPDLIPFLKNWCKNNGLVLHTFNKIQ